jgi:hypothetical protein
MVTAIPSNPPNQRAPIDLDRRFFEVPRSVKVDLGQYLSVAAGLNKLSTWDDVLAGDCSIVLGEAGSGKTTELRQRTRVCRESGQVAFFLPIEALASDGLSGGLDPAEGCAFEAWRCGNGLGIFFLDSVDEAKLGRLSLETALRKLAHGLGTAVARAHMVISCRVSDWDIFGDEMAAKRALERKVKASEQSDGHEVAPPRVFGIAPLAIAQVRALAVHIGIPKADDFVRAIEKANAGMFVERPADVRWLAAYWQRHERLGTLRELVDENARTKLRDIDRPAQARMLSEERAWDGATRLAGAATLSGRISFVALGNGQHEPDPNRDLAPAVILGDWSPSEIAELLRLPLFDESTFGRVRIHERTVQEYLAAAWLRSLLGKGLPRKALDGLLFPRTPHLPCPVLAPHLRATAAWLALDDPATRRRLAEIAPEALLGEGDPSGIPVDERRTILTAYANRFRGRRRIRGSPDRRALSRFVSEDLSDTISQLVSDRAFPEEVRCALLTMVAEGGIRACARTALQIATDLSEPAAVRAEAVMAAGVVSNGAAPGRRDILALINETNLDQSICGAILMALFPSAITDEEVSALLINSGRKPQNTFTGLQYFLEYELDRRCPPERRLPLARRFLELMRSPDRQALRWLARTLVILLRSGLQGVPDDAGLPAEIEDAFAYFEGQKVSRGDLYLSWAEDLTSLLSGRPEMRRQLFWKKVHDAETKKATRIASYFDLVMMDGHLELGREDLGWLTNDALKGHDDAARVLAFDTLRKITLSKKDSAERDVLVQRLAGESASLRKHLERRRNTESLADLGRKGQHYRKMKVIENRRNRQQDDTKAALEKSADGIRKGKHVRALWHLYTLGAGPGIGWGKDNTQRIAKIYGDAIAGHFVEGVKNFWRQAVVPARHKWNKPGKLPTHPILGLAGISLEVEAGLNLPALSPELRSLAIRIAVWEVNQFPEWFDALATLEPEETRAVLLPLIRQEMETDGIEPRSLRLGQICRASASVRSLVAPAIIQSLLATEPKRLDVLEAALESIEGSAVEAAALEALAPSRCQAAEGEPKRLAVWLVFWMNRDGVGATEYLSSVLASRDAVQAEEMVEEVLSRMWTWSDARLEFPLFRIHQNAGTLARLVPIAFAHVRRSADRHHESTYCPGRRDHAQEMRDRLLSWLSTLPPDESLPHLRKLAALPGLEEIRDYLQVQVEERISADSSCAPWTPEDVVVWASRHVRQPRNCSELFTAVSDVLLDIKADFEDGDHSNKQLFSPKDEPILERLVQRELVKEMKRRAVDRFVTVAEEEIGDENFPDIRAHKSGIDGAITVEVKVAERWSYSELRSSISNQIAARYLRDPASTYGILAIASSGPPRPAGWKAADGRMLSTFVELVVQLGRDALQIQDEAGMKTITVVAIDFH